MDKEVISLSGEYHRRHRRRGCCYCLLFVDVCCYYCFDGDELVVGILACLGMTWGAVRENPGSNPLAAVSKL